MNGLPRINLHWLALGAVAAHQGRLFLDQFGPAINQRPTCL